MSYYPDGTGPSDKRAPWNLPEPKVCENCDGTGLDEDDTWSGKCRECDEGLIYCEDSDE